MENKQKEKKAANILTSKTNKKTIAKIAYEEWINRGRPEGDELTDWLEAEQKFEMKDM